MQWVGWLDFWNNGLSGLMFGTMGEATGFLLQCVAQLYFWYNGLSDLIYLCRHGFELSTFCDKLYPPIQILVLGVFGGLIKRRLGSNVRRSGEQTP